jgi:hypothetical protein
VAQGVVTIFEVVDVGQDQAEGLDMARKSAKSDAAANPGAPPSARAAKPPRGPAKG